MKKEFTIENATEEENQGTQTSAEDNQDEIDPEHIEYLQNQFQDDVVDAIFENIVDYIKEHAVPLCEFMTRDDVEVIIDELQSCES